MKNYLLRTSAICLALGFAAAFAVGQDDTISAAAGDRYIVSARAGGVNYVEGTVGVVRKSGRSGLLLKGDTLNVGDRVSTAANGKVEILLNPGSFLRLGGTSAFEFNNTSLDELELRLDSGTAILEVYAADEFKVNVKTPSAAYSLVKSGVFRIDIPNARTSTLSVWKGAANVGEEHPVKAGRTATVSGENAVAIGKFDRDTKDPFDEWSKSRSKTLAQQTANLRRKDIRTSLMQGFLGGRWNFLNSFGLWLFLPAFWLWMEFAVWLWLWQRNELVVGYESSDVLTTESDWHRNWYRRRNGNRLEQRNSDVRIGENAQA